MLLFHLLLESFLNRMPAEYANTTYLIAKGVAVDYELDQKKLPKTKKGFKKILSLMMKRWSQLKLLILGTDKIPSHN